MNNKKVVIPKDIIVIIVLACVLNLARVVIYHSEYFLYLFWNLFLALIPFIISSILLWYANNKKLNLFYFIVSGIVWLLFLPNAPYIITDMIHLGRAHNAPILYDTALLFSFAWVGLMLCLHSLYHIEQVLRTKFSQRIASLIIAKVIFLTSFGMYLGRYLRFNSWDLFVSPSFIIKSIRDVFSSANGTKEAIVFTCLFFFLISMSYIAWGYTQKEKF